MLGIALAIAWLPTLAGGHSFRRNLLDMIAKQLTVYSKAEPAGHSDLLFIITALTKLFHCLFTGCHLRRLHHKLFPLIGRGVPFWLIVIWVVVLLILLDFLQNVHLLGADHLGELRASWEPLLYLRGIFGLWVFWGVSSFVSHVAC